MSLTEAGVKAAATCKLQPHGGIGLMFRRRDNGRVVTVVTAENNVSVHSDDMAVSSTLVQDVASAEWWSHDDLAPPQGAQRASTAWEP